MELIVQLGIIFVSATILAYISKLFKQPIIPAYILAGLILVLTGVVGTNTFVETISELGIAFLLFIVGLEIDFKRIKDVGLVSTIGGTVLVTALFGIGFLTAMLFALTKIEAIYIGLVIAFSSTMVVIKLLSDRSELDTLHGRIIIGILLMQDIFAIIALFALSALDGFTIAKAALLFVTVLAMVSIMYIAGIVIFPTIFKYAARSEEILFITAVSVCLLFIGLFEFIGLSIAIGAFLAGLILGNLPYSFEIISLVKPLRDFFAVIFFVSLGMQLDLRAIQATIPLILVLLVLIIFLKPFLTMIIVSFFGYMKKPAYLTSVGLAQASEFSLILLVFGVSVNHISQTIFSSVILVTIITMALTSYFFQYERWLYSKIEKFLGLFEKISENIIVDNVPKKIKKDVLLVGCDRIGYNIFNTLRKLKQSFIVVDYNPEIVKDLMKKRIPCIYGDIGDVEILRRLNLKDLKTIISTAPDKASSLLLLRKTKEVNKDAIVMVTCLTIEDALDLYEAGADYVILPHFLGGERVSLFLEEIKGDVKKVMEYKLAHLKELKKRSRRPRRKKNE